MQPGMEEGLWKALTCKCLPCCLTCTFKRSISTFKKGISLPSKGCTFKSFTTLILPFPTSKQLVGSPFHRIWLYSLAGPFQEFLHGGPFVKKDSKGPFPRYVTSLFPFSRPYPSSVTLFITRRYPPFLLLCNKINASYLHAKLNSMQKF